VVDVHAHKVQRTPETSSVLLLLHVHLLAAARHMMLQVSPCIVTTTRLHVQEVTVQQHTRQSGVTNDVS
jgi:hypothetical protein